jgi:hypothetical protein
MFSKIYRWLAVFIILFICSAFQSAYAFEKGIYINQSTMENKDYLNYLIARAKEHNINTFVIDLYRLTPNYQKNIKLVLDNNIKYVARVVVFPEGGEHEQIISQAHWEKRYQLVKQAVALGAQEVQLDYIRYNTKRFASTENAKNIHKVISWFKGKTDELGVPLQIDVFGITSFGEEPHIGQNVDLFADSVDAICPMNYPSHFEPFRQHAVTPYDTVYDALTSMKDQFTAKKPKIYSYIETYNYRYPLTPSQRVNYIKAQINAVHDADADGWYAWSANNKYDYLFDALSNKT